MNGLGKGSSSACQRHWVQERGPAGSWGDGSAAARGRELGRRGALGHHRGGAGREGAVDGSRPRREQESSVVEQRVDRVRHGIYRTRREVQYGFVA